MRAFLVGLGVGGLFATAPATQDGQSVRSAASDCAALAAAVIPDVRITEASAVAADSQSTADIRVAHCRVSGIIGKETHFILLLPDDWNRRFFMGGAGGFAGSVDNMAQSSINAGYATVGTDAGHAADGLDASWALHNTERVIDYGYLAVHRTAEVAKELIRRYYGAPPVRSYFYGCSNGGREALMEAQRFPGDFDGIVAQAPAADFTGTAATFIRNLKVQYPTGDFAAPVITQGNLDLVQSRVLDTCDARDGVRDGILDDPRECTFTLASVPSCPDDAAAPQCLTNAQRTTLAQVYAPLVIGGRTMYPGQPLGNEAEAGGWSMWVTGPDARIMAGTQNRAPTLQGAFGVEFFKYFVFGDSTWDYRKYELAHADADMKDAAALLNATNPDLGAFKARGGKLILAHGWSDPALSATATISYYKAVVERDPAATGYVRLFMMPGVLHCAGGPGCDRVDWYKAIADWVETGKAPDIIIAGKVTPATATSALSRTRPLCAYPEHAVYAGRGSTDNAGNYFCK